MTFREFRDLSSLSPPALRALLNSGDGRERIWAAWEIALRAGGGSAPALSTEGQPDPGVRSHLVVILAGLGETETLRAMAIDDPDSGVRGTVCDYLCRVTPEVEIPSTADLLRERIGLDPSPIPVVRILEAWPHEWPPIGREHWEQALDHSEATVRKACLAYLRRLQDAADVRESMTESLRREPDPDLLVAKARFVGPAASAGALVRRATEDPGLAPRLLALLVEDDMTLGWEALRPHLWSQDPVVVRRALQLTDHQTNGSRSDYIVRLGEIVQWGSYRQPDDAFALSHQEQERRGSYHEAIELARDRLFRLLEAESPLPLAIGPALGVMLHRVEDDLRYFLTEDIDYLQDEGTDSDAEISDLNARRKQVLGGMDRLNPR